MRTFVIALIFAASAFAQLPGGGGALPPASSGGSSLSLTATLPVVITPSPCTTAGCVVSAPTAAIGPGSSTANHLAEFSGTDGVTLIDGGASYQTQAKALATGILKNTTSIGVPSIATSADIIATFSGTCNSSTVLTGAGTCATVSSAFSAITSGTNTVAAMVVGTGASIGVTGAGTIAATSVSGFTAGAATLTGPAVNGVAVGGGDALTTSTWIPWVTSAGLLTANADFTFTDSGNYTLSLGPSSNGNAGVSYRSGRAFAGLYSDLYIVGLSSGRSMQVEVGLVNNTPGTNSSIALSVGNLGAVSVGKNNRASDANINNTFNVTDGTATTGATRMVIGLGAADSTSTVTQTNGGTTKAAGYQSSDGTAGITGTTCVAATMQVKNGLVVAGCS